MNDMKKFNQHTAITALLILVIVPVPCHQLVAYFSGTETVRLSNILNFVQGLSFSIKTCSKSNVGQILHQSGANGDSLTFILLSNGELRLKWLVQGLEDYKIVGYDLNDNVWHSISMKYLDPSSLVIIIDGRSIVLSNSTYQPHLQNLNLSNSIPGSLIIGQNFDGCISDGTGVVFSQDAQFSRGIQLDTCPLDAPNACAPKAIALNAVGQCSAVCENGGQCVTRQTGESFCQCSNGFSGNGCEININDCIPNPCMNGAQCIDGVDSYKCVCINGFIGIRCEIPVNACTPNPCKNNGECSNRQSGYECRCRPGWTGSQCEISQDICASSPCSHGSCSSNFVNAEVTYSCQCHPGYTGKNCDVDIDDCVGVTCPDGKICLDLLNNAECRCPVGYGGVNCQEQVVECVENFCSNGGICSVVEKNLTCQCQHGWYGEKCEIDVDECEEKPCLNGICVNTAGSFQCYCTPGFSGVNCSMEVNECLSLPCKNDAFCENKLNSYHCKCAPGYIGRNCETEIDECEVKPCKNGATCLDLVNAFNCTCVPGFAGIQCEINIDECESIPCGNGGQCTDLINAYECNCTDTGFSGMQCEKNIDDCEKQPCVSDSNCTDLIKDYNCSCHPGYRGKNCEEDINECQEVPCQNGATCFEKSNRTLYEINFKNMFSQPFTFASSGGYFCECLLGFNGSNCENNIDDCVNNDCMNGTCVDGINEYSCNCTRGFEGEFCNVEIDECERYVPCQNGASCLDLIGDYDCKCPELYGGKNCSIELIGCRDHQCFNGATCVPYVTEMLEHKYNCSCANGFYGEFCKLSSTLSFNGNAFITGQKLPSFQQSFSIKLGFRTTLPDGVLIVGSSNDNIHNFVMAIKSGLLMLNVSSNNLVTSISTGKNLILGKDYITADLHIQNQQIDLQVGNERKFENFFFQSPESLSNVIVGGHGFNKQQHIGVPSFIGCMQDIIVNGENRITYVHSDLRYEVIEGCNRIEQCDPTPCNNGGRCTDLWNKFSCQCFRPYFGDTCSKYVMPATFGFEDLSSLAAVEINAAVQDELQRNLFLSFFIRTRKENGILFYLGPQAVTGQNFQNYILAQIYHGKLEVTINSNKVDVLQSTPRLDDGYYHKIEVSVGNGSVKAFVNDSLNLYQDLYGGANIRPEFLYMGKLPVGDETNLRRKRQVASVAATNNDDDFKGILWDVQINGMSVAFFANSTVENQLLAVTNNSDVMHGIVSDDTCESNPCENGGRCNVTWNDYNCICPPAFRGKNCSDHKPCSIYSCPVGGQCIDLKNGYECVTTANFNGMNSSISYSGEFGDNATINSVSFRYRTNTSGRAILFLKQAAEFLVVEISSQIVLHSQNNGKFKFGVDATDGNWHNVTVMFNGTHAIAKFDQETFSQVSYLNLQTLILSFNPDIYVGSVSKDIKNAELFGLSSQDHYFKGCIEELRIGGLLLPFFERAEMVNDTSDHYFQPTSMYSSHVEVDNCQLCYNSDCQNNGQCIDEVQSFDCHCQKGFEGQFCQINIDECAENDCQNNATCIDGIGDYSCQCTLGYVGNFCETDLCSPSPCLHGNCTREKNAYQCQCLDEYTGDNCTEFKTCNDKPCGIHGNCISKDNNIPKFFCNCSTGYTGLFCNQEIDYCESSPCKNGGTCASKNLKYECACKPGWTGNSCEIDVDDCASAVCQNGGTCIDGMNNYTCQCPEGFEGTKCEEDVNECISGDTLCLNGGTCNNIKGSFNCSCSIGWVGQVCNVTDLCYTQPSAACFNGGLCAMNLETGESLCHCPDSYSGDHCADKVTDDVGENLAIVIGPAIGAFLLICLIAGLTTFFMMARKKRATRGTYSPSRQEMFGSRVEMGNVMKPPPEERLI